MNSKCGLHCDLEWQKSENKLGKYFSILFSVFALLGHSVISLFDIQIKSL